MKTFAIHFTRLMFYWSSSFALATGLFYLLQAVMPHGFVFAAGFRMFMYHQEKPLGYLALVCFFFGLIALPCTGWFSRSGWIMRGLTTLFVSGLTVLVASPFGGMLYFYHDMQAGFFLPNWVDIMIRNGVSHGLGLGWAIALASQPYCFLAVVAAGMLLWIGGRIKW